MSIDFKDHGKKPYVVNIEDATLQNENYRTTIWTGEKLQVTVMTIQPNDDIGLEVHHGIDQFIRIEEGDGVCVMGDSEDDLYFKHNITNTGDKPLKLYTIYAGPDHVPGTVHPTHEDAKNDPNEH